MNVAFAKSLSDQTLSDVVSREAVLWLTDQDLADNDIEKISALANRSWRAIFVESTSDKLARALEGQDQEQSTITNFRHVIASDPSSIVLQRRAQPVFFLNGRSDKSGIEGTSLSKGSTLRRRLNMIVRLRDIEPIRVVVLGESPVAATDELADLWYSEFRALLTVVCANRNASADVVGRLAEVTDLAAIEWVEQTTYDFAETVSVRIRELVDDTAILVSVQVPGGRVVNLDLTEAESQELPLSDACEFIRLRDTLPVSPQDLSLAEFQKFFARSEAVWRAYAAGLPWTPDLDLEKAFLSKLRRQLAEPPGSVQVLSVVSEPGAGGTTQARAFAFAAAKAGFPPIIVKQHSDTPSALELTNFMFRATQALSERLDETVTDTGGPVWLIVLDVQHSGRGADDLQRLCAEFSRSGRRVAILKISRSQAPLSLPDAISHEEIAFVGHDLETNDVTELGAHLNTFLRYVDRAKTADEWQNFWRAHAPDIDVGFASFWVALEFWLAGYLDLGESIQSWLLRQFKNLPAEPQVKKALLEVAAFSIERRATPERLLGDLEVPRLPWSVVLESARENAPGLGLVQAEAVPYGRVCAITHDVLARYLVNAVWNDRLLCDDLNLEKEVDPVALRLALIERLSGRSAIGEAFAFSFAVALATDVLKLDERVGNAEFFPHWRKVLDILGKIPSSIRLNSRTFNHHVAISRRRITQDELFQLTPAEKRELLTQAVGEVEFALERIDASFDDETDLNLLNTLALLYQDLARVERGPDGDKEKLAAYLAKSEEITNRALKENPNSPYVLETAAKSLLRQLLDMADERRRVEAAAKALSFIFQASQLDSAASRRMSLGFLAGEALRALRAPEAEDAVEKLCQSGSPYGYVAKAWRALPITGDDALILDSVDSTTAATLAAQLNESPERDWLLVRLQYDLMVIATPNDFQGQLRLLDELSATRGYQLSLQQRLERAVLLYIEGQHKAASEEFRTLRPRIKEAHVVVSVPLRLRWMLAPDRSHRATCTARVADSVGAARGMAKVQELGNTLVPFNAQEFDKARMAPGEQFKCQVTFAAMGPFLKPLNVSHR
ncbi:hypothetical protein [Burkholderia stagnalis]|uniref:hypothetical protein n=1 Tax=Burkholderia stagnalis TaxID=1503054 RepID=UPI000F55CC8D|nr:hypothetical protein [Burkholderia stagnalis]